MSRAPADQSAEALIALYAQAWERVRALQTEALTAGTESQRRRKMRELMQLVKALAEQLDDAGYRWASSEFPQAYALGAQQGLQAAGEGFSWTPEHTAAATAAAVVVWGKLQAASTQMVRSTIQLANSSLVRQGVTELATSGLESALRKHGIRAVTYSNGARHNIADYVSMLVRTAVAETYNNASTEAAQALGIKWFQGSDGPNCGLVAHGQGETVNGMIADAKTARSYALGHPNCRRVWYPRADIKSKAQAKDEQGSLQTLNPSRGEPEQTAGEQRIAARLTQRQARLANRVSA